MTAIICCVADSYRRVLCCCDGCRCVLCWQLLVSGVMWPVAVATCGIASGLCRCSSTWDTSGCSANSPEKPSCDSQYVLTPLCQSCATGLGLAGEQGLRCWCFSQSRVLQCRGAIGCMGCWPGAWATAGLLGRAVANTGIIVIRRTSSCARAPQRCHPVCVVGGHSIGAKARRPQSARDCPSATWELGDCVSPFSTGTAARAPAHCAPGVSIESAPVCRRG